MSIEPSGAVALREALARVPFKVKQAWAIGAPEKVCPGYASEARCPHSSHWQLDRLREAWADLESQAVPVESGAEAVEAVAEAMASVPVRGAPKKRPAILAAPAEAFASLSATIAQGEKDRARLARVRALLRKRERSRDVAAPVAPPVAVAVNPSCPAGWHPATLDPAWTPGVLDPAMDWLLARRFPTMLTGPAGTGKTEGFRQACARAGLPCVVIPCARGTGASQLLGGPGAKGGEVSNETWVDGDFLRAVKAGVPVVLDEMLAAQPSALAILHDCLSSGVLRVPETGEECKVTSWIGATSNSVGADVPAAHEGEVSAPMLDRFVVLSTGYGTEKEEMAVLAKRMGVKVKGRAAPPPAALAPTPIGETEIALIAGYQSDVNAAYMDGKISRPLTRRGAYFLATLWGAWGGTPEGFARALEGAFLDRLPPGEMRAAMDIGQRRFPKGGKGA